MTDTGGVDSGRIRLSVDLTTLADRFTHEATLWHRTEQHTACIVTARRLDKLSRAALGTLDTYRIIGELEAAEILLGQVQGTRRFFEAFIALSKGER